MSDGALSGDVMRQFEGGLAKVKFEFQKNIHEIDPLDSGQLDKMMTLFNQRLVIFQHEFLEYLAKVQGSVNPETLDLKAILPMGFSTWWIWALTIAGGGGIGAAIGAPTGLMTAGVSIVGGAAAGALIALCNKHYMRKHVRQGLEAIFEDKITPALRAWAKGKISTT